MRGNWADNAGRTRPIGGRLTVQLCSNIGGSAVIEIGRSTYQQETKDLLVVSDSVLQADSSWRVSAVLRCRRNNG